MQINFARVYFARVYFARVYFARVYFALIKKAALQGGIRPLLYVGRRGEPLKCPTYKGFSSIRLLPNL